MKSFQLNCGSCNSRLSFPLPEQTVIKPCPSCGQTIEVNVFPSLFRLPEMGKSGEKLTVPDESSCFYHPQNKAVVPCSGCGRFLCSLCDVDWGGKSLCPVCIQSGENKGEMAQGKTNYVYYDEVALALAVFPLLIFYFTLVTAPMALYFAIRYFRTPISATPRNRWRFILAIVISTAQIVGWIAGFAAIIRGLSGL
jgi:uncharacterized paraquat-inducible protein A